MFNQKNIYENLIGSVLKLQTIEIFDKPLFPVSSNYSKSLGRLSFIYKWHVLNIK